jgi:hypothetical protein
VRPVPEELAWSLWDRFGVAVSAGTGLLVAGVLAYLIVVLARHRRDR